MTRLPTYLRVVVTTICNYFCDYCHMEGDPQCPDAPRGLPGPQLIGCLEAAVAAGIKKFKLLGGEPLLRPDLPEIVAALRGRSPDADISAITAADIAVPRLEALFAAGLSRINITIHGFTRLAFSQRNRSPRGYERRDRFIEAALSTGRPVKLNYVYRSEADLIDLGLLLEWAAERGLLINVLDDLSTEMGYRGVAAVVRQLRGEPERIEVCTDPDSLSTLLWRYRDGLRVELKHLQLGELAPYSACSSCASRPRCKEGIYALRLTHTGELRPCMDRPDLSWPLSQTIQSVGLEEAVRGWRRFVEAL